MLTYSKLWYGLGFAMLLLVALLSLMPVAGIGGSDKLAHFLSYAMLSGWFSLLIRAPRSLFAVAIGLIVFGVVLELLQGMTSYRMAELADAAANSLGVAAGLLCFYSPLRTLLRKIDTTLSRL